MEREGAEGGGGRTQSRLSCRLSEGPDTAGTAVRDHRWLRCYRAAGSGT
jgi:hypothetical protein